MTYLSVLTKQTPIEVAKQAALLAGDIIIKGRENKSFAIETKSSRYDLVTDIDREADAVIIKTISSHFPDHQIMTEETFRSSDKFDFKMPIWIVDPIDGTKNFVHGHPYVAVAIAFMDKMKLEVGVVHCPFLKDFFHAVRQGGAFLNGKQINVDRSRDLKSSLISTPHTRNKDFYDEVNERMLRVHNSCDDLRRFGSATIEISNIAAGRSGGCYLRRTNPWDMAAPALIVKEAGGVCSSFIKRDTPIYQNQMYYHDYLKIELPGELYCDGFYACSKVIEEEFLEVLR